MKSKRTSIVTGLIFAIGTLLLFLNISQESLWNDEACTVLLMRHSFFDMLLNLRNDFHSPLYFISLKAFTVILGDSIFTLRFFSVIGLLALASLGMGPVKRLLGTYGGLTFSAICLFIPVCVSFSQEARMYTWACFFVTGMVLFGYYTIKYHSKKDWILYAIFAIFAVYIHIYALLEFALFHCFLLIWVIWKKQYLLKPFIIVTAIISLSFTPWAFATLLQIMNASRQPWFVATNAMHVIAAMTIPFGDKFLIVNHIPSAVAIFLLSYVLYFKGVFHSFAVRREPFPVLAAGLSLTTLIAAIALSILIAPILMPRYFFTLFGIFAITAIYGLQSLKSIRVKVVLGAAILLLFIPERIHVHANRVNGPLVEITNYLTNGLDSTQVFIHSNDHTFTTFAYYFPRNLHYLYKSGLPEPQRQFTSNGYQGNDWQKFARDKRDLWFVNTPATHEDKHVGGSVKSIEANEFLLGYNRVVQNKLFMVLPKWYPGRKYSDFEITPYWFQVQLSRYRKGTARTVFSETGGEEPLKGRTGP